MSRKKTEKNKKQGPDSSIPSTNQTCITESSFCANSPAVKTRECAENSIFQPPVRMRHINWAFLKFLIQNQSCNVTPSHINIWQHERIKIVESFEALIADLEDERFDLKKDKDEGQRQILRCHLLCFLCWGLSGLVCHSPFPQPLCSVYTLYHPWPPPPPTGPPLPAAQTGSNRVTVHIKKWPIYI